MNKYISFETAKLAKDKGCDIDSVLYYDKSGTPRQYDYDSEDEYCYRLSHPVLDDWIGSKHDIHIEILIDKTIEAKYCYSINKYDESTIEWTNCLGNKKYSDLYLRKDECYEDALKDALKYINNN